MYELEDTYWWYRGLRAIIFEFLGKYLPQDKEIRILDAGCGTGGVLQYLKNYGEAFGIDISGTALGFCKRRKLLNLLRASASDIPFKSEAFDVVVSTDVICHFQVKNDIEALKEIHRVLKKNGIAIVNVPACEFLKTEHDQAVYTKHRYTGRELSFKLKKTGFTVEKLTYWDTILFPFMGAIRLFKKLKLKKVQPRSDLKALPVAFNHLLASIILREARLLKKSNLPFGLSVFGVGKKKTRNDVMCETIEKDSQKVIKLYSKLGKNIGLYAKLRWKLCPYEAIEKHVPLKGKVIDIGCGYGLFTHLLFLKSFHRNVIGIDWSVKRIEIAQKTVQNRSNIQFYNQNIGDIKLDKFQSIVMIDVLHHLPIQVQQSLLLKSFKGLNDKGRLIILDVDKVPRWKYLCAKTIDRLLNISKPLYYHSSKELSDMLTNIGFKVKTIAMNKGIPLADVLFICDK